MVEYNRVELPVKKDGVLAWLTREIQQWVRSEGYIEYHVPTNQALYSIRAQSPQIDWRNEKVSVEQAYVIEPNDGQAGEAHLLPLFEFETLSLPNGSTRITARGLTFDPATPTGKWLVTYFDSLWAELLRVCSPTAQPAEISAGSESRDTLSRGNDRDRLMDTASQAFMFDADAREVCTYILASDDLTSSRTIKMTDNNWACECYLSAGIGHGALYFVAVSMNLSSGRKLAWTDDSAMWQVHNKEVAEIVVTQDKTGGCKAELFVERNRYRWTTDGANMSMSVGLRFIGQLWHDLIEGWIARKLDATQPTQPGMGIGQQGEANELDYLEKKILAIVQSLRNDGQPTGDENVAARLPSNSRGKSYTREWINKKRNAMRKRGIDV